MQNLSKWHGVFEIEHWNPINVTKQKKKDTISNIMISKLFMDGIFAYLNCFLLLTLFASFNWNLICFNVFCVLSFEAQ
jgi:hypothetical protein